MMRIKEIMAVASDPDYDGFINTDADIWDLPRSMEAFYEAEKANDLWWKKGKDNEAMTKERLVELRKSIKRITGC